MITPSNAWPVDRQRRPELERAEVRRAPLEPVGHGGKCRAAVDRGGARAQTKVELARVVEVLHRARILRVESRNAHEDVVVDEHAVAILPRRARELLERAEFAGLE